MRPGIGRVFKFSMWWPLEASLRRPQGTGEKGEKNKPCEDSAAEGSRERDQHLVSEKAWVGVKGAGEQEV